MLFVGQFDQVLPGSTRFDQVRPHPAEFELIICNPPLISTPVWKVKQQHVSIMHFTSLRCQSEQLHPIWIFSVFLTYSSLRWRAGSNHLAIIPQPLTFVGLPKWLVDPIAATKGVEHGGAATTCVCIIVYGIHCSLNTVQCTYMYVNSKWLMCIQSTPVEWLAAIVNWLLMPRCWSLILMQVA